MQEPLRRQIDILNLAKGDIGNRSQPSNSSALMRTALIMSASLQEHDLHTDSGTVVYWVGSFAGADAPWLVFLPGPTVDHTLFDAQIDHFSGEANLPRHQGPLWAWEDAPPRVREEPQPALRRLRARGPRPARAGGKDPGPDLRVGSPGPRRGREPNAGRRAARPEAPTRRPQVPRWMKSTHRPI